MNDFENFAAQLQAGIEVTPWPGLSLPQAYDIAGCRHALRLAAGDRAIGRKIGHTHTANWAAQGLSAPSWGWLYANSTMPLNEVLNAQAWREPKVELECVLRLARAPKSADELPACVDAMALGLEIVDRPYPSWQLSVADSVAAGGVHAALLLGPWQPLDADLLSNLQAELQGGNARSEGGSALVFGSPLRAVQQLMAVLAAQGAPGLQAGELITTGALAPALPLCSGDTMLAKLTGFGAISLRVMA